MRPQIEQAGDVVKGVLDNNIVCTAEKEIIAVASIADARVDGSLVRTSFPIRTSET